ncbi:MAG: hypothetical protein IIB60_00155 [Planctomycetes bacterium]|nr:hypothetical protein [Planctomycetota bacterium]
MQAYDDLGGGRFVVIADFENPAHMELFQLISVSDKAACVLDTKGGRVETGRAAMRFTAGSPDDTVVITNTGATNWYLKRDWRPYDLFLMAVESPRSGLCVEVTITTGPVELRSSVHSSIPLDKGWNFVRLDLAEVGEHVPLDDVREIRLSVSGSDQPRTLHFDDLILTGNRVDLFGDSRNTAGALYVQRVGRRWNIGAGGRFEITLANGQIVGWYNLAQDPYRQRNLVAQATLGPSPLVLSGDAAPVDGFAALGEAVAVHPRVEEANAVRVVVACDWRFVEGSDAALWAGTPLDRPFQRWVYTIYATGQIYAAVECTARTDSWSPSHLGLAVELTATAADGVQTHTSSDPAQPPAYALARSETADYALLYAMADPRDMTVSQTRTEQGKRRVSFVASASLTGKNVERWVCQLLLGSAGAVSYREALARAGDYWQPGALELELGSPVTAGAPDLTPQGFDRASGCHVIAPDRGRVRFVIDGREHPRFSPAFKIIDSEGLDAWVYVNHLIFHPIAHDVDGNLIFQLPDVVTDRTTVEVLLRPPPAQRP